jgi:hypothetical protein
VPNGNSMLRRRYARRSAARALHVHSVEAPVSGVIPMV